MTHLELLQKLPSPIREQAIENAKKHNSDWLRLSYLTTVAGALSAAFPWASSPECHDYWEDICGIAREGEFDDPSVTLPREDWEKFLQELDYAWGNQDTHEFFDKIKQAIQQQLKP